MTGNYRPAARIRRSIYEVNYERLLPLIKGMTNNDDNRYRKLESKGFMPLVIEVIGDNEFSIAHYYTQEGDAMRDPEMTVRIYPDSKMVEALSYLQDNLGIYQVVYPEPGKYVPNYKSELNKFLGIWLKNIEMQGFIKNANQ